MTKLAFNTQFDETFLGRIDNTPSIVAYGKIVGYILKALNHIVLSSFPTTGCVIEIFWAVQHFSALIVIPQGSKLSRNGKFNF